MNNPGQTKVHDFGVAICWHQHIGKFDVGAVDYLLKPIDDNQLTNKISTYFRLIEKERDLNRQLEAQVAARTAELHTANRYLRGIIETMGEALLVLEPSGNIKSANPATCKMLGYDEHGLIGLNIGDVFEESGTEPGYLFCSVLAYRHE